MAEYINNHSILNYWALQASFSLKSKNYQVTFAPLAGTWQYEYATLFKQNNFNNTNEIKRLFPSCSFVGENRVVFNISGNKYRLVVYVRYDIQIVYIRFIGTHAEYDKINVKEI